MPGVVCHQYVENQEHVSHQTTYTKPHKAKTQNDSSKQVIYCSL